MSNTSKVTVVALPELRPRERRRMGMLREGLKNMKAQVTDREALSVLQRKKRERNFQVQISRTVKKKYKSEPKLSFKIYYLLKKTPILHSLP